jgi:hypothetical protein
VGIYKIHHFGIYSEHRKHKEEEYHLSKMLLLLQHQFQHRRQQILPMVEIHQRMKVSCRVRDRMVYQRIRLDLDWY